jgi:hypothetical protein
MIMVMISTKYDFLELLVAVDEYNLYKFTIGTNMLSHDCVQGIWESILITATLVITNFLRVSASLPRVP